MLSPLARRRQPSGNPCDHFVDTMQRRRELTFWGPFAFLIVLFVLFRISFEDTSATSAHEHSSTVDLIAGLSGEDESLLLKKMLKKSTSTVLKIAPSIAQAIRQGKPVVALESTVVTHGG